MKIEWTEPAVADLKSIKDFFGRTSKQTANHFVNRILESVESLKSYPKLGWRVPETAVDEIREVFVHSYRIIYRIEKNRILVLTIVRERQEGG
jgi:toxin ParE1/3/4